MCWVIGRGLCLWPSDSETCGWKEPSGHFLTSVSITTVVDTWENFLLLSKLTMRRILYVSHIRGYLGVFGRIVMSSFCRPFVWVWHRWLTGNKSVVTILLKEQILTEGRSVNWICNIVCLQLNRNYVIYISFQCLICLKYLIINRSI